MILKHAAMLKPIMVNLPIDSSAQRLRLPISGEDMAGAIKITTHMKRET